MIFTDCVTEPVLVKTVSKKIVSAEKFIDASGLVIKEFFLHEMKITTRDNISSKVLLIRFKNTNCEIITYNETLLQKLFDQRSV